MDDEGDEGGEDGEDFESSDFEAGDAHTVTNFQGKRRVSANTTCAEEIFALK